MTTTLAAQMHEAMLEDAAAKIFVELARDEPRQSAPFFRELTERGPVLMHNAIEKRLAGTAALIAIRTNRTCRNRMPATVAPGAAFFSLYALDTLRADFLVLAAPAQKRSYYLALFAMASGIGFAASTLVAGFVAERLGSPPHGDLRPLFIVSALGRAACALIAVRVHDARNARSRILTL